MNNFSTKWLVVFVVAMAAVTVLIALGGAGNSGVDSANIVNSSILEEDLASVNSASDEECLTYETDIGDFEWQDCVTGAASDDALTLVFPALKASSGTITAGSVVKVVGFSVGSDAVLVELADASNPALMPALGVTRTDMTNVTLGEIVAFGRNDNIDTSSYTPGVPLYVDTTPGLLTPTRPSNGDQVQLLAFVIRSHGTNGRMGVVGAGRANDIPNITDDYIYLGDSNDLPVQVLLPDCDANVLARIQYSVATNSFACEASVDLVLPGLLSIPRNDSVSSGASNRSVYLSNAGTGDSVLSFFAGDGWAIGVDNSDTDAFKLSRHDNNLNTRNYLEVDNAGAFDFKNGDLNNVGAAGTDFTSAGAFIGVPLTANDKLAQNQVNIGTLGVGVATLDIADGNVLQISCGDAGGNSITTITGGVDGTVIYIHVNNICGGITLVDSGGGATTNQMNTASGNWIATSSDVISLVRVNNVWYEISRSQN